MFSCPYPRHNRVTFIPHSVSLRLPAQHHPSIVCPLSPFLMRSRTHIYTSGISERINIPFTYGCSTPPSSLPPGEVRQASQFLTSTKTVRKKNTFLVFNLGTGGGWLLSPLPPSRSRHKKITCIIAGRGQVPTTH